MPKEAKAWQLTTLYTYYGKKERTLLTHLGNNRTDGKNLQVDNLGFTLLIDFIEFSFILC